MREIPRSFFSAALGSSQKSVAWVSFSSSLIFINLLSMSKMPPQRIPAFFKLFYLVGMYHGGCFGFSSIYQVRSDGSSIPAESAGRDGVTGDDFETKGSVKLINS